MGNELKDSENDLKQARGCLIVVGAIFVLSAVYTAIGIIFKGEGFLHEYNGDIESPSTNFEHLRTTFFIFIIALVMFIYFYIRYKKKKGK